MIRRWLARQNSPAFNAVCIGASFGAYFCMYAFRKPFAAGTWEGTVMVPGLPPLDEKVVLVIAQLVGYTASKFLGIKVIAEMPPARRAAATVAMVGLAEIALVALAVAPPAWRPLCLFINGLPLGLVWGLVFGFLEGRQSTELLAAGLSASYVVASGAVKSVGRWVLTLGMPEPWMPAATGALFVLPFLACVWVLSLVPPPSAADERARVRRRPMSAAQRTRFLASFAPGLVVLIGQYMLLTAYRDFRDSFARELWDALGYGAQPAMFTLSELPVAAGVLVALALVTLVRSNRAGVAALHGLMLGGTALIGLTTLGYQAGFVGPAAWMTLVGLGLYLAYVPFGSALFDRLIAVTGFVGTAGFMIYVADSFGYLGSVGVLLYRNLSAAHLSWLAFFTRFSLATSAVCTACFAASWAYFGRVRRAEGRPALRPEPA